MHKYVLIDFSLTVKAATYIFIAGRGSAIHLLNKGNQVLFTICLGRANVPCKRFMKILTVYSLNSHFLTLKAHNYNMYDCSPLKNLKPHRQTEWTQIRLLM